MTDATTAARAIQANHAEDGRGTCGWCDSSARCPDFDNAGVVLEQINEAASALTEAIENLRAADDSQNTAELHFLCRGAYEHAVAALACLRSEDAGSDHVIVKRPDDPSWSLRGEDS